MMRASLLACVAFVLLCSSAFAFNERGHMVVGHLAWLELDEATRAAVIEVLKEHPHYEEFLTDEKPDNIEEDEWAFMRAGVWSDWVRSNYSDMYHRPTWHYINIPFVPEDSEVTPPDNVPPPVHVVRQISWCSDQVLSNPSDEWKAVNLTWVFHLVADVHQPLHCATMFSEQFPDGDRGGNSAEVRIGRGKKKLHSFWDGVMGRSTSVNSIRALAQEIKSLESADPQLTADDLANHTSPSSWAQEGFDSAVEHAYLNGKLEVANAGDHLPTNQIPEAPEDYAENAGKVVRIGVAKAGHRLAKQLRQLVQ